MNKDIIILGAGGHGNVIKDVVISSGDRFVGFLDDNTTTQETLGPISDYSKYKTALFVIGIGDNSIRKRLAESLNCNFTSVIHPSAIISNTAIIRGGTVVMPGAIINSNATIGNHCIINSHAVIEHDDSIGDYTHISPGAVLCGNVSIGNLCHIGAGATIKNNISITDNCVIGLAAGVVKNITESGIYVGIPAKKL